MSATRSRPAASPTALARSTRSGRGGISRRSETAHAGGLLNAQGPRAGREKMKYASAYATALVLFLILDGIWLATVARSVYIPRIGSIMLEQPRWGVAAIFYLLYPAGLVYFAVLPGWRDGGWQTAVFNGAVLGFIAYLTYNATNLALLKGYEGMIAVLDTAWGAVASAATAGATVAILAALGRTAPG